MKKLVCILGIVLLAMVAFSLNASADTYTYSWVSTNNYTNTTAALPVSGYLDKIELSGLNATRTTTVVIATFADNSGTNPVDTLCSVAVTTPKVIRLRVMGTDNGGTAFTATAGTDITNYSRVVAAQYEKVLIGGNVKIKYINDDPNSVTNTAVFYFEPLKR